MKQHTGILGTLLGALLVLTLSAQDASETRGQPGVVVGTFDSRAVAVAYVRSDQFDRTLRGLREELEEAKAKGDRERVAELEALGPTLQQRAHRQGFGAAPVDDIVARIEDELPHIAAEAGVDLIVSKWVLAYRDPSARLVDVTDRMAAAFDPDEETLRVIRELVATEPVPLDELEQHEH